MRNRLAVIAAAAVLCACATSRPPGAVPAPTPEGWHAPLPHEGTVSDLRSWWQQWDDPLLVELIVAAEDASPDVASAAARIAQARATRAATNAALWPSLDANASLQRGNSQPPLPLMTVAQAGLQAQWEIDLFGGNRAALAAARAREREAQAGWHDARVAIAAETANNYIAMRTCERQLRVAENDARSRAETARLSRLSEEAGFTAPADAALARAGAAEASARATQQRAQCDIEVKTLVALSGIDESRLRTRLAPAWTAPSTQARWLGVASVPAQAPRCLFGRARSCRGERGRGKCARAALPARFAHRQHLGRHRTRIGKRHVARNLVDRAAGRHAADLRRGAPRGECRCRAGAL